MVTPRLRHWLFGFILALSFHLTLTLWFEQQKTGAIASGIGGIEINLGPSGGMVGAVELVEAETIGSINDVVEAETIDNVDDLETNEQITEVKPSEVEPSETVPIEPTDVAEMKPGVLLEQADTENQSDLLPETTEITDLKAIDQPQISHQIEPETISTVETIQPVAAVSPIKEIIAREPAKPKPAKKKIQKPKRKPKKPAKKKKVKPKLNNVAKTQLPNKAKSQKKTTRITTKAVNPKAGSQGSGKAGSKAKNTTGSDISRTAGGNPAAKRNYYAKLAAWLNKHKRYPRRAKLRRQQGIVKVRFTIDRNGRVLANTIVNGSGHRLLDKEVQAMLKRASPMPPIPKELRLAKLTITVPVSFKLR